VRQWLLPLALVALLQITGCGVTISCLLAPSITGQPTNQVVAVGQPAMFAVAASGSGTLGYQWLKNGVAISGATAASYVTPVTSSQDSGSSFSVTVSNSLGRLTSSPATLTVSGSQPGNLRFVAPNGSDANTGSISQPFQTIQHCATVVAEGWTCEVRAGTYRETVTPNSGITIAAYNLEAVVVDGTDPITGWTLDHDSVYRASATLNPDDTNQIFVGSEMMTEARWPNGDDLFHVNWALAKSGTDSGHIVDSKLPSVNWTGAKVHLWSGTDPFGNETGTVTASSAGQIAINIQAGTCPSICPVAGGYYYIFGILGALDVEREWFYDPTSTTVYFMAPGKVDPSTLDVRGKRREYAFDLSGRTGVTIRNIAIFGSTIATDQSSSNNVLDGISAQYVSHFTTLPTAPSDPDGSGFTILQVHVHDTGIILNGTGNILENSAIAYSAGAGVALEGNGNTVRNNLIYDIDYIGDYASGIDLDGDDNTIQYNTVHDIGRQGLYVNAVANQDVSYNNFFNAMMLSRDGAEIYACCNQAASGTRFHHNWLHDTQSLVSGPGDNLSLAGVYIDNGSSNFNIDQNVLWKNQAFNAFINGAGNGFPNSYSNDIHNNTVPDKSSNGRIRVSYVFNCTATQISDNRVAVPVEDSNNPSACVITNNSSNAPGATEMSTSTGVGCNFGGCSSEGPPAFQSGGSVSSCPVSVFAK